MPASNCPLLGFDDIYAYFLPTGGNPSNDIDWVFVVFHITYKRGSPSLTTYAPSTIGTGQSYQIAADTDNPDLVGQARWTWYLNGDYVGTTTDPSFTTTSGAPDSYESFAVVVSDDYGHSTTGYATIYVCPGNQIHC